MHLRTAPHHDCFRSDRLTLDGLVHAHAQNVPLMQRSMNSLRLPSKTSSTLPCSIQAFAKQATPNLLLIHPNIYESRQTDSSHADFTHTHT